MYPLYFLLVGVVTGLLMSLFGIGGGAFLVPAIDVVFLTVPNSTHPPFPLIVIGSLCAIVIGSLPKAIGTIRKSAGERKIARQLIISALPFIAISSIVATQLSDAFLRQGFAIVILIIGVWTVLGKTPETQNDVAPKLPTTFKIITIGAVSGISSALFGLGGATLLMPLLTMWAQIPIMLCVDISILYVAFTSIFSLLSLSVAWIGIHGKDSIQLTDILLILSLGFAAAITQIITSKKLTKMNAQLRRTLLGIYLICLGLWVITKSLY